jgi:Domain of unknown function (DUF6265)
MSNPCSPAHRAESSFLSRSVHRRVSWGAVLALWFAGATAQATALLEPIPEQALAPAAWLAGCWNFTGREAGSSEQWMAPAGGAMLGMSRTLRGGAVREFEFMVLRADPQGLLSYSAWPAGKGPTVFMQATAPATAAAEPVLVFENPNHDFPQRIIYRRDGADRAFARIEGRRGGSAVGLDFPMRRVACP